MRLLALLLFAVLVPLTGAADDSMVYIEYRLIAPEVKPGTFAASVRKVWRHTDSYARIEEEPDPQTGIHGLMISNAPNSYLINQFNKVARHIVDPGPTYNVIIPVFPSERSPKFKQLQMGRELTFLRANGAVAASDQVIGDVPCSVLVAKVEDSDITLFLDKKSKQPRQISISNPRNRYAVRYEAYRTDLPVDLTLFRVPKDVQVVRAN